MRLLQLKIRGLGDLPETVWLQVGPRCTVIGSASRRSAALFIKAIEALNPLVSCRDTRPFDKIPLETTTPNGYKKLIDPAKRTIAFGIYDSPSSLVHELGDIAAPLYETDRIEVGRRLDLSRWINFVELSASSRWSEVSGEIFRLFSKSGESGCGRNEVAPLIDSLADSDRIKGETAVKLAAWLNDLSKQLPDLDVSATLEKVERWQRFKEARRLVEKRLPLMISVPPPAPAGAALKRKVSEVSGCGSMAPVILVDLFEHSSTAEAEKKLRAISSSFSDNQIIALVNPSYQADNLPARSRFHSAESLA